MRVLTRLLTPLLAAVLLLGVQACATGGSGERGNGDTITHEQLLEVSASDVYEAVQRLQPSWLTSRGPRSLTDDTPSVASVYMSGSHVGDVEFLRTLQPDEVEELRYYEAGEASARFGMGHPRGVIEVHPR